MVVRLEGGPEGREGEGKPGTTARSTCGGEVGQAMRGRMGEGGWVQLMSEGSAQP